jgi:hypothetical protein
MQLEVSFSLPEQYIHAVDMSSDDSEAGGVVITMLSELAECIHTSDYATFDMTFKRINSKGWNEWELVVWCKLLMRCKFFFPWFAGHSRLNTLQGYASDVATSSAKPDRPCV